MTIRTYRRLQRWDRRTRHAYDAGFMDGMDARYCDNPRPIDPDDGYDAPFDLNFYVHPRRRFEQQVLNHNLARERGRVDGWDSAAEQVRRADEEEWIERQVEDGIYQLETFLWRAA